MQGQLNSADVAINLVNVQEPIIETSLVPRDRRSAELHMSWQGAIQRGAARFWMVPVRPNCLLANIPIHFRPGMLLSTRDALKGEVLLAALHIGQALLQLLSLSFEILLVRMEPDGFFVKPLVFVAQLFISSLQLPTLRGDINFSRSFLCVMLGTTPYEEISVPKACKDYTLQAKQSTEG
eukprot:CAMPEP_0180788940 /NCGR_PEP_ID=MMETSP1038_2-20121128/52312_1 /TAXON_ID=632150 /ORGANISM="Azadinium spinosum, Strain 3D9" /LENGTH=179 /DNA_ID=CAMNT_0022826583 /DNA_START=333 /DNA_END=868 /DNA_ORIENTATION=+